MNMSAPSTLHAILMVSMLKDACSSAHSPAKINLRLDVLGNREDGYHEIESIMTRISLYDEVSLLVEDGEGLEVISTGFAPSGEGNIAYKAAVAMLNRYSGRVRVRIEITKNIPVAAGLDRKNVV